MVMIRKFRRMPLQGEGEKNTARCLARPPKASTGEEFFRIPRAEFLLENCSALKKRSLGELVVNASHNSPQRFTLPVEDNTMCGAGLHHGDVVVVQPRKEYQEGALLAFALGERVLIRRFFLNGKRVRLESDPPTGQTIIAELDTPGFQILGQVIQILREL